MLLKWNSLKQRNGLFYHLQFIFGKKSYVNIDLNKICYIYLLDVKLLKIIQYGVRIAYIFYV